jgi:hypothetical protein
MMTGMMKRRKWDRTMQTTCLHRPMMPWTTTTTNRMWVEISSETKKVFFRREAMEKRNCKQEESAIKAMKICGQAALDSGVGIGALVSLNVDYHTHCHVQGLLVIVYRFQENSGGILVCDEHGIITHGETSTYYWVPYDKYRVIVRNDTTFPISNKLQAMHDKVLAGCFVDDKKTQRISFSKYVGIDHGTTSPVKKTKGCSCKKDVI